MKIRNLAITVLFSIPTILLGGCTTIQINGDVSTKVSRLGVLKIDAEDGAKIVTYQLEGFGIIPSERGTTLGYRKETVAIIHNPKDCRIVIFEFPKDEKSKRFWREFLSQNSDVCRLKQEKKNE